MISGKVLTTLFTNHVKQPAFSLRSYPDERSGLLVYRFVTHTIASIRQTTSLELLTRSNLLPRISYRNPSLSNIGLIMYDRRAYILLTGPLDKGVILKSKVTLLTVSWFEIPSGEKTTHETSMISTPNSNATFNPENVHALMDI